MKEIPMIELNKSSKVNIKLNTFNGSFSYSLS